MTAADEDSDDSDQCGPEVVSDPVDTEDNLDTVVDAVPQSKLQQDGSRQVREFGTAKEVAQPHHSRWFRVE